MQQKYSLPEPTSPSIYVGKYVYPSRHRLSKPILRVGAQPKPKPNQTKLRSNEVNLRKTLRLQVIYLLTNTAGETKQGRALRCVSALATGNRIRAGGSKQGQKSASSITPV